MATPVLQKTWQGGFGGGVMEMVGVHTACAEKNMDKLTHTKQLE